MRYLIISDIHSNIHALDSVLAQAQGKFECVLCLGDIVGYGAFPNECCERLRALEAIFVVGNHDGTALGWVNTDDFNTDARTAAFWTREQLSPPNWAWLGRGEEHHLIENGDDESFEIVHGSWREPHWEEYILGLAEAGDSLNLMASRLGFCGHTHSAGCFVAPLDAPFQVTRTKWPQGGHLRLSPDERALVNPGSVGQPRDGNPQARAVLLDARTFDLECFSVNYPIEEARAAIIAAGLPSFLGDRLREGR